MADLRITFRELCDVCEKVQTHTKFPDKESCLSRFIQQYKDLENTLLQNNEITETTFFPVLRLLVPEYERERSPYGLKETSLSRLVIRILCLRGNDANNLENYNKISTNSKNVNDFAKAASAVLSKWCSVSSSLMISDVNLFLDQIANKHAEHLPRDVDNEFHKIIKLSTSIEMKWIIRIILKYTRIGLGNDRILKVFHPDAPDMFDVSNSLSKICTVLKDPKVRLHELDIELFTPFRPMLSLQCDSTVLNQTIKGDKVFYVENKYDGERFQMHMRDGVYKYFSKNGYEYSKVYGENINSMGLITPHLAAIFKNVDSIILDGEMMGWNTKTKHFGSKGMHYDVKNLKHDSVHRPCYCVFDILYLNGTVLTNRPLSARLNILNSTVKLIEGVILISPTLQVKTKQDMLDELNKSVERQDEGICFKDPDSVYKPNNRKGGWWKLKLEYFEGLMNELDVIIIGGYYGDGKRQGMINSFLLGVAESPQNEGESPSEFHSFAKVATGMSAEELDKLLNMLKPYWEPFDKNKNPTGIVWKKEKPDVWIDPRKSCILQIKASELTRTSDFQTDYTLRFPRVEKIRYDKPWYNCLTLLELKELTKSNKAVEKLNGRFLTEGDVEVSPSKRTKRAKQDTTSLHHLLDVEQKSNLLANKEYCVYTGCEEYTKQIIEVKIKEYGGTVVQVAGSNTECILVGDVTPQAQILIETCTLDIVKLDWMKRILDSSVYVQITPSDMINISLKRKLTFSNQYDKYGDSYTEKATKATLEIAFKNIETEGDYINLIPYEFTDFDNELSFENILGIFRMCFVYFDKFLIVNYSTHEKLDNLRNVEHDFSFYGGTKCEIINELTTHIVVHTSDLSRLKTIKEEVEEYNDNIKIVNEHWIEECIKSKKLISEELYLLHNL